jgi:GDP-L-fucose synthase
MKIYVAGHRGLVGSALTEIIDNSTSHEWVGQARNDLNLLDHNAVKNYLSKEKPDAIILAAAKVGGIKSNSDFPVEFLSENLMIQTNVINAAHECDINKFVFLGSSCIYPKFSLQPIKEEYLLTGPLEPTNEPYALAKIAGLKLIQAYRTQYARNWISVMPTNVYGPRDNFDLNSSHVVPALIRKFHDAKVENKPHVELWGTGTPRREFLYSEDLAKAVIFLFENYNDAVPINVGAGKDISIFELANLVSDVIEYRGDLTWNKNMPDGAPRKLLDSSRISELGWEPKIELREGIENTYKWYLENKN